MQFAAMMARSNFVPMHLRGKEGDCMAIVMQASRWGMDPFAVGNKSYFVKDGAPPAFEAQLVNAVVNSSGVLSGRLRIEFDGEGERLRCTVTGFLRADPDDPKVRTVSIARITTRNSPLWKADPMQQLAYYTTRSWARLWVPEVLMGVYTPDEIDVDPERARNVTPPMPRRGEVPVLATREEPEEEDEQIARRLDAETLHRNDGTLDDTNPAAGEGPADEQRGDGFDENDPRPPLVLKILRDLRNATKASDLKPIDAEYVKHRAALDDDYVAEIDAETATAKARIGKA